PTGEYLASGSQDGAIKVWDAQTGRPFRAFQVGGKLVSSVAFSPDGKCLAAACSDGRIRIWDVQGNKELPGWEAHRSWVNCLVFSADGQGMASSCVSYGWEGQSEVGEVKVWNVATSKEILTLGGPARDAQGVVAFSPDGRRLATGAKDGSVKIWDATTGRE